MRFMLDTNICVFLLKGSHPMLFERVTQHRPGDFVVSAITAAELEYGVAKSARIDENRRALHLLLDNFEVSPFDPPATRVYGAVRRTLELQGTPIGPLDTLIAAHALSLEVTLITNNLREFERVSGLVAEDWTSDPLAPRQCAGRFRPSLDMR